MIDKGQLWEFGQDTEVTPLLFTRSAMGFLLTTDIQDLGLMSHAKNGFSSKLNNCSQLCISFKWVLFHLLNIYRSTQMGSVISVQIREWMNGRLRGRRQSFDVLSIRGRWSLLWLEENWSTLRWTRYVGGHTFILRCHLNVHLLFECLSFHLRFLFLFQSGQLNEYTERKEMSADVVCMSLANVPPGEQRSRFLAVGLVDNTVRIISLDPSVSYNLLLFSWPADLDIKTRILVTVPTELVWSL